MPFRNIIDQHAHTDNSFDGHHAVTYMCEVAVEKGIRAVTFTDHLELDAFYERSFDTTARQAFFEISRARSAFTGKLIVGVGAEFGEAVYVRELSEKVMNSYRYDFVVGSIHNLPGRDDFCDMKYSPDDNLYPLLDEYFDWELKMAQWGKFDTLAHLTYPLRYIVGDYGIEIDMSRYTEIIDEILSAIIHNRIALEINTSGYRQPYGMPFPYESIVMRYKELGGELVTLGSDAHFAEHLGMGIDKGYEIALRCGFDKVALYQEREPILIPIA